MANAMSLRNSHPTRQRLNNGAGSVRQRQQASRARRGAPRVPLYPRQVPRFPGHIFPSPVFDLVEDAGFVNYTDFEKIFTDYTIEDMPETTSVWEWAVDEYGEEEVEAPVAWSRSMIWANQLEAAEEEAARLRWNLPREVKEVLRQIVIHTPPPPGPSMPTFEDTRRGPMPVCVRTRVHTEIAKMILFPQQTRIRIAKIEKAKKGFAVTARNMNPIRKNHFGPRGDLLLRSTLRRYPCSVLGFTFAQWRWITYKDRRREKTGGFRAQRVFVKEESQYDELRADGDGVEEEVHEDAGRDDDDDDQQSGDIGAVADEEVEMHDVADEAEEDIGGMEEEDDESDDFDGEDTKDDDYQG